MDSFLTVTTVEIQIGDRVRAIYRPKERPKTEAAPYVGRRGVFMALNKITPTEFAPHQTVQWMMGIPKMWRSLEFFCVPWEDLEDPEPLDLQSIESED